MDQMTQRNAAMAEEATAATQQLAAKSEELLQMVGRFRLGDAGPAGAHASARAA